MCVPNISVNLSQIATEHVVFREGVNTTLSCIVINISPLHKPPAKHKLIVPQSTGTTFYIVPTQNDKV